MIDRGQKSLDRTVLQAAINGIAVAQNLVEIVRAEIGFVQAALDEDRHSEAANGDASLI